MRFPEIKTYLRPQTQVASNITANLFELLEAPILAEGYELLEIEFHKNKSRRLQLFIDGPNGIGIDDCVIVNQVAQEILDKKDPLADAYTLEVSSPGIFRKLKTPVHFQTYTGARIKVRLRRKMQGLKSAVGQLQECTEEGIRLKLESDGSELLISFPKIAKANLEPKLTV